jgi:hypothetical protein
MFRGFNLSLSKDFSNFKPHGEKLNSNNCAAVQKTLDTFLTDGGVLNGTQLQEHWFPQINADVFISHSHQDKDIAVSFAGFLAEVFKLKPFIDSCVWGYADNLLKQIDDKYCKNSSGGYDYDKIKGSTSHIHMMLSTALGMMIDNTECLMFLNTPNSISSKDVVTKTQSPWLYMEIAMSVIVRRKSPQYHRKLNECTEITKRLELAKLKIEYDVNLTPLKIINQSTLVSWESEYAKRQKQHSLDILYSIVNSSI